jgi:FtsZ-binding cell division protein ZapB
MERVEGFFEARCRELETQVKTLQYDNADLSVKNDELSERVNQLANRQPAWPKGFKPQRRFNTNK